MADTPARRMQEDRAPPEESKGAGLLDGEVPLGVPELEGRTMHRATVGHATG